MMGMGLLDLEKKRRGRKSEVVKNKKIRDYPPVKNILRMCLPKLRPLKHSARRKEPAGAGRHLKVLPYLK
jgi:hypothetical protein